MDEVLAELRLLIGRLEPELLAWESTRSETNRQQSHALATRAARQLQIILNALRPPLRH
jgi:hypothetical protein